MPYKDKNKRYEAIRKSWAKKPEHYRRLCLENKRKSCRRGYYIMRNYGLTLDNYNALLQKQEGGCAVCKKVPSPTKTGRSGLHVDHDHVTGKVRGLLCSRCNTFMGYADKTDFTELITKAEAYLAR